MLIVGLGNPGKDYEKTRHNIGFRVIDRLSEILNTNVNTIKFKGLYGEGRHAGQKIQLLKPQTYMNLSGESVREVMDYFKLNPEEILVIVDDIDIDFSTLRIKPQGKAGTHNGLKSIIKCIDSQKFPRLRIGIGKKHPNQDLAKFVLSNFPKDEEQSIQDAIDTAAEAVLDIVEHGLDYSMNKYN